jgi:hypothetical protein
VRESTTAELVSLLMGHLPRVDQIFLDPVFGAGSTYAITLECAAAIPSGRGL